MAALEELSLSVMPWRTHTVLGARLALASPAAAEGVSYAVRLRPRHKPVVSLPPGHNNAINQEDKESVINQLMN